MVEDPSALERRMGAVGAVRQVVNAIWALARAQLPLVESAADEVVAYLDEVDAVVARLAGPRQAPPPSARTLLVVVGPERPWCGGLPRDVLAQIPAGVELGLVGRRLQEVAADDAHLMARVRFRLPGAQTPDDAPAVAMAIAEELLAHLEVAHVEVLHPTGGGSRLASTVLLGGQRARSYASPQTLSPWDEVLRAAVFEAVASRLTVAAVAALRSEVRARMAAAEQARTAADRKLEALQHEWRTARQEAITTELVELVAGRAALSGR